jgi:hypothetical protein
MGNFERDGWPEYSYVLFEIVMGPKGHQRLHDNLSFFQTESGQEKLFFFYNMSPSQYLCYDISFIMQ